MNSLDPRLDLFSGAKEKAAAYREAATTLNSTASRPGTAGNYLPSGDSSISSLVTTQPFAPRNDADPSLYQKAGQSMVTGALGSAMGDVSSQYTTLNDLSRTGTEAAKNYWEQSERNRMEVKMAKLGAGGSAAGWAQVALGGLGALGGAGVFGGGTTTPSSPVAPGGDIWGAVGRLGV